MFLTVSKLGNTFVKMQYATWSCSSIAIIKAMEAERFAVPIGKVSWVLGITTAGERMALGKLG